LILSKWEKTVRSKNDNLEMVTLKKQLESEELKHGISPTLLVILKVGDYNWKKVPHYRLGEGAD
jgi:hypothetical protein